MLERNARLDTRRIVRRALPTLLLLPSLALAAPWAWDQDGDGLDDRLEQTALLGIETAFENADPEGRLRYEVGLLDTVLQYGAYVLFESTPTPEDSATLVLSGAEVVTRFSSAPYIRVRALYPSLLVINDLPRVVRVEAMTLMYPVNWQGSRSMGVRRGQEAPFPTVETLEDPTGNGVVVAVLDTGINDEAIGIYPGHLDLATKVVGGADYGSAGPAGYTAWTASTNPDQASIGLSGYHGTHVAGTIAGGDRNRILGGVSPDCRLLDVKVLADDGRGSGLAEGLEWCILNRTTIWGGEVSGIDVINLSLSGLDSSDGTDCVSRLVNAAVEAGIVVVASSGNDGTCASLSNPGAADLAVAVGATDPGEDAAPEDDFLAAFSQEGPRIDDGDLDFFDELKPLVVAPGVGVASAWGSPASFGRGYQSASGTSMSAAFITGLVALLLEADPGATPAEIASILRDTAVHRYDDEKPCSLADPYGVDARYHTGWGYGQADAVSALAELLRPDRTQFVRLSASWDDLAGEMTIEWITQREADLAGFVVERAADVGGAPGSFTALNGAAIPSTGFADLSAGNRTPYAYVDDPPTGNTFWYRVRTTGGSQSDVSPVWSARAEASSGIARFHFQHDAPETDLTVVLGSGGNPSNAVWSTPVDLLEAIDEVESSTAGGSPVLRFSLPLFASQAAQLPPSVMTPWWLRVDESGAASTGTLYGFSIEHGQDTYDTDSQIPRLLSEGQTSFLWVPEAGALGATDPIVGPATLRAYPNPFRARTRILFEEPGTSEVTIFNAQGRLVRTLFLRASGGDVEWDGLDDRGAWLPAGAYYVRLAERGGPATRVVLLPR